MVIVTILMAGLAVFAKYTQDHAVIQKSMSVCLIRAKTMALVLISQAHLCKTNATKLIFMVDSSYSSSGEPFRKQLQYITDVVSRITISASKFSVAVISYGTEARADINFNSYENKTELLSFIQNITFVNGTTNIPSACIEVKRILQLTPNDFQFVFLFTDGMPTSLSAAVGSIVDLRGFLKLSNEWNDVFLVAFGDDVRHEGFRQLSGDHRFGDVYPSINMEPLHQVFKKTVNIRCSACKVRRDSDIVFALDTSTIQSQTTYKASLGIFVQLMQSMDEFVFLGSEYVQIGTVHFSDTALSFLPLNFTTDLDTFASTFQAAKQDNRNSSSSLANALQFIWQEMFSDRQGARYSALKYVVFVNNGFDINMTETYNLVEEMTKDGIALISIGVGKNYKDGQVLNTASSPFHAYFSEQDRSTNQWTLQDTEFEFIKRLINRRLECTNRVNA
ncbi:cartilage matrix protein-like [Saccostrea cucullata]|uniref:cartilage matrix protein-like n=1 Tax=Saccostrea cuccullata TaxID=36930 RepID=UPI002ED066B5